jgi:hypothetical protein
VQKCLKIAAVCAVLSFAIETRVYPHPWHEALIYAACIGALVLLGTLAGG